MSSRENILASIRAAKPEESPLPHVASFAPKAGNLVELYQQAMAGQGGQAHLLPTGADLGEAIEQAFGQVTSSVSCTGRYAGTVDLSGIADARELAQVQLGVVEAHVGVAENGALFLREDDLGLRAMPFIVEHLAVVLQADRLVWNMHQAYAQVELQRPGFNLMLAGPSKTADIEQSLVIGAHGPRSLQVFLLG